jgi:hypothetical protein
MSNKWVNRKADLQFLIDSGLLFAINHQVLHLVGLALTVSKDKAGNQALVVKDARANPETLVFSKEVISSAYAKLQSFILEFGGNQMDVRRNKLGWSLQPLIYGDDNERSAKK